MPKMIMESMMYCPGENLVHLMQRANQFQKKYILPPLLLPSSAYIHCRLLDPYPQQVCASLGFRLGKGKPAVFGPRVTQVWVPNSSTCNCEHPLTDSHLA